MKQRLVRFLSAVAVIILASVVSYTYFMINQRRSYYHRIIKLRVDERQPIYVGGTVHIEGLISHNMPPDCNTTISRFISSADSGEVVFSQIVPGLITNNGEQLIRRTLQLPDYIKPGEYVLTSRANSDCSDFQMNAISPQALFTVLQK